MSRSELIQLARSTYGAAENGFVSTALSLEIAAAAPALSIFWAWQIPTNPAIIGQFPVALERLRLQYHCITAFTDPTTAGRSLAFCKLDALPSGSTSNFRSEKRKSTLFGGAPTVLITNTGTLTPGGAAPSLNDLFAIANLSALGHEGDVFDHTWEWTTGSTEMIALIPGDVIGLVNPQAMDAAGTFCLAVEAEVQGVPSTLPIPP